MINDLMLVGDCRNEAMVEDIFGSVSNFALQVESCGDSFQYGPCMITYDKEKDIHNFYYHVESYDPPPFGSGL